LTYVDMQGISKAFPGVLANDAIHFSVEKGTIHALLGENGAGKSTLMRILYGIYRPDEGKIFLDGEEVEVVDPQTAIDLGIGMVHQEFQLVPSLTVAENIALGHEPSRYIWIDRKEMKARIQEIVDRFGFSINLDQPVVELSVGAQQYVEIIKLLYREARILILDEPTAVLTPQEIERLFSILRQLRDEGRTIIFITHKLREVKQICSRATILRRGKVAGSVKVDATSERELASLMVGRQMLDIEYERSKNIGEVKLRLEHVRANDDRGVPALKGIGFEVRGGEIVGLAGVQGNGQSELVDVIGGMRDAEGDIYLGSRDVSQLALRGRRNDGLAIIPEKRKEQGLNLATDIAENVIATRYFKPPFSANLAVRPEQAERFAAALMDRYAIKAEGARSLVSTLSGGNQQKVITARELADEPDVLIAAHPTRGLDVAAARFVREELIKRRDQGGAVLLVSADLDELFALSDRLLVMYDGEIVGESRPEDTSYEEVGLLMAGHTHD